MEIVSKKVACVALLCMAMIAVAPLAEALTCGTVSTSLAPCLGYLVRNGPLDPKCCAGIKSLVNQARTAADRQSACNCLKSAAKAFPVNLGKAAGLPAQCGTSIPYAISPSTDCSKVH